MRRSTSARLAVYAGVLVLLVLGYVSLFKGNSVSGSDSIEIMAEKAPVGSKEDVAYIHLEDVIPVPEGENVSPEILYKNIMNEKPFSPVVIFSKSYCGFSRAAKQLLLEEYELVPPPRVVELDLHPQGAELQQYLAEITGRRTVPNVLVLKESYGGASEMQALHEKGELGAKLREWGKGHLKVTS